MCTITCIADVTETAIVLPHVNTSYFNVCNVVVRFQLEVPVLLINPYFNMIFQALTNGKNEKVDTLHVPTIKNL